MSAGLGLPGVGLVLAVGDPPAEWGSDADLDEAMLRESRKLAGGPCPLAGSAWCESQCPWRDADCAPVDEVRP